MTKLSLIIPSISPERWYSLAKGMELACRRHSFEIIFVGPKPLTNEMLGCPYAKAIRDFGCPARCLQMGALIAEGEYLAWASDDCFLEPDMMDEALDYFDSSLTEQDGMALLYSEGENYTGTQHEDPSYWIAYTHPDLRLAGVNSEWKIAPIGMYKRATFCKHGGFDCAFETVNFNTHDLAFAVQHAGGRVVTSPHRVFRYNWSPDSSRPAYQPVFMAFIQDQHRMRTLYSNPNYINERNISLDNWRSQPALWPKRYGQSK